MSKNLVNSFPCTKACQLDFIEKYKDSQKICKLQANVNLSLQASNPDNMHILGLIKHFIKIYNCKKDKTLKCIHLIYYLCFCIVGVCTFTPVKTNYTF